MERRTLRRTIGIAMVVLGLVQAGFGVAQGEGIYAALGVGYAVLGGLYFWFEGSAGE